MKIPNKFYLDFDEERYTNQRERDYRTSFQRDRDRIIHSSAFRRLQAKTQVFIPGEYDFYRNRLTHSLEVAQIGTSICWYLFHWNKKKKLLPKNFYIDEDLVEGICLAHDIGHPPFGHSGERTLNKFMKDYGGFEGNAQTLRIIMETISSDKDIRTGMEPTRAFTDGVMKYKMLRNLTQNLENHFLYTEQKVYRDFIFGNLTVPSEIESDINKLKSIECQIMDWADDIAYALGDLADGIKAGFITISKLEKYSNENEIDNSQKKLLEDLCKAIKGKTMRVLISKKIGSFVRSVSLEKRETFLDEKTNRYQYNLKITPEIEREVKLYREISKRLIFKTPSIQQMDYKGERIVSSLFTELRNLYVDTDKPRVGFLPYEVESAIHNLLTERGKLRKICDYIAGMSDGFAIRTYKRLFDPQFGSITDLIETG